MGISFVIARNRKKAKKFAWAVTIAYLVLLPFLGMLAVASIMVFDSPSMTVPVGLSIIIMYFCMPLSVPVTIYFVWSRYLQGNYRKSWQCCLI